MKSEPLVSVIMNGYNAERYLREAIDSVLAQTYQYWELIFWDNCSTDSTSDIVQSYSDVRLKYYCADEFSVLGKARNLALKKASGEFIAFLDCDDIWFSKKLELQLPLFDDQKVGLVYSDAIYFNSRGQESRLYATRNQYKGSCFRELLTDYCLSMQTVVLRHTVLDDLTYWFDERFNIIEEYDLFVRISEHWKLNYVATPLAKWRMHADSWSMKKQNMTIEEQKLLLKTYDQDLSFNNKFPGIIEVLRRLFLLREAKLLWSQGSNIAARKILVTIWVKNSKALIMWFLSFLPFSFVDTIYNRMKGRVIL